MAAALVVAGAVGDGEIDEEAVEAQTLELGARCADALAAVAGADRVAT